MTTLAGIYDRIPAIQCKGLCYGACGPIGLLAAEAQAILASGHPVPKAADSLRHGPLTCSALDRDRRCRIYANRPLICRLYGTTKVLRCEHGCEPERWVSDQEASAMFDEIQALGNTTLGESAVLTVKVG